MYDYLNGESEATNVVGSFITDKNADFKDGVKSMLESFRGAYSVDAINDLGKILKVDNLKEDYKERLIGDVLQESSFMDDEYLQTHPDKLEQIFENSALEIVQESSIGQLAPIVGLSLPILKKNYLENHAKDIVMTEVPSKPIVKVAFERKFLKDKKGEKHYIPDIFYNDSYKEVVDKTKGKPIASEFFATPVQDLNLLQKSGGTMETRDSLSYDIHIAAVKMQVATDEIVTVNALFVQPDMANNGGFNHRVKAQAADGTVVEDILVGQVEFYNGTVSVASTAGRIKEVQFGGHLSNENNLETVELDREREVREWKIPDGQRINTGLTIEKLKDYKALFNIDVTTEVIADISTVLTQFEDSGILDFLDTSLNNWRDKTDLPFGYKDGFVETYQFSATPPTQVVIPTSQWINSELKYTLNRQVDSLKEKLKTTDIMFVIYGNPANITLIQDDVKWVIDEDTKIGGIQLDYRFGVMTANKNRIHVVSSMKVSRDKGIRIAAFPLSKEVITFKHYKYSLNIENIYRNPFTPLTPNVMGTARHLTTEVLPVQGELKLINNDFGRQTSYAQPVTQG
jgi:hypothetical protein